MPTGSSSTVERAFELLSLFSADCPDLSLKDVSARLRLPRSSAHRFLHTLKQIGVLKQNPITSEYSLSLKLWQMGSSAVQRLGIREIVRPVLERMGQLSQETIFLAVLDGGGVIYLDRVDSPQPLRTFSGIGARMPAHSVSSGKCLMAFSPPDVVNAIIDRGLERYTPHTITDPSQLLEQLEAIRLRGYATSTEERLPHMSGAAGPVFAVDGKIAAAVAVSGPSVRMTEARLEELGGLLREVTKQVSVPVPASSR